MMKLSDIPFEDVKIGTKVQSDSTKRFGVVGAKYHDSYYKDFDSDGDIVVVDWEAPSGSSYHRHYEYFKVTVI